MKWIRTIIEKVRPRPIVNLNDYTAEEGFYDDEG